MRLYNPKLIFIILCIVFLQFSCGKKVKEPNIGLRPVRYIKVSHSDGGRTRTFSGSAQADTKARLSFKISGTVVKIPVEVGDKVKKGDIIAELNPEDYRLQVQETEASLRQSEAQARNAEANYKRIKALYEKQNASRNDLDSARASYESTNATVQSIKKRLEQTQLQLEYTKLVSPADGAIAETKVEENENVNVGQIIAVLSSGSHHKVKVAVPEIFISQIKKDEEVAVVFDAIPNKEFEAVVTEVSVSSTDLAKTYPVTVVLRDADEHIRSGMAAEVAFSFAYEKDIALIIVPTISVGEDRLGRYVFIVKEIEPNIGIIHRRPVKTGKLISSGIEITEGLKEGELVVTAGVSKIKDGMKVKM